MITLSLSEIAAAVGVPDPGVDVRVSSVEFDTRRIQPGALFLALRGEHADGHDYAGAAKAAGAVAVLGSREIDADLPLLRLADDAAVLAGLAAVASLSVARLAGLQVIGLTGSAGKTSTKDLIAAVLRAGLPPDAPGDAVVAPPESFNNEIGHPYTVLLAGPDTRQLVLELSARGIGHIAELTRTVRPQIGAVLNVGSAHLGEFGSVEAIQRAKSELVQALPPAAEGGVAVLNADDPRVLAMAELTQARIVTTGTAPNAEVRAENIGTDPLDRAHFTLLTPEGSVPVQLGVSGEHQVSNALIAAAVGRATGLDLPTIAAGLAGAVRASKWRMEITERADGVTIINDAYNANPESMRAALRSLASIGTRETGGPARRTWAVLGQMAELGEASRAEHDAVGRLAVRLGVDRLIVVGEAARAMHLGACMEGSFGGESELVADSDAALEILHEQLAPGDVVLVKASRSVNLQNVAIALTGAKENTR